MGKQIIDICQEIAKSDMRVVLLTSSDSKAFCSGADLKERDGISEEQFHRHHKIFAEMFNSIADLPQPVIAVVDGYALAGGFELALNCDMILASERGCFWSSRGNSWNYAWWRRFAFASTKGCYAYSERMAFYR